MLEKVPDSSLPLPEHEHHSFHTAKEVSKMMMMMMARLVMHKIILYIKVLKCGAGEG